MIDLFCIKYTNPDMKNVDKAGQIKIEYRPQDTTLKDFLILNRDKRVYIEITNENFFSSKEQMLLFKNLVEDEETGANWTIQMPVKFIYDAEVGHIDQTRFEILKASAPHYMFTDLIGNWEILDFIITLKPSEVYLTNILAFDLPKAFRALTEWNEIGIRLYANWAQSAWDAGPALTKFFIRPEDAIYYEPYVTGIEFQGTSAIQDEMWDTYAIKKKWYGNLGEIIIGFTESLDSTRLPKLFGKSRACCGKRCVQGSICTICRTSREFAQTLDKINVEIKQ